MNCHNGAKYLREAIDSVFRQTYPHWEIVFWDNQSTDTSPEIARTYDSRLRYFKSETFTTLGAARRLAIEKARGDWIAFLDCDDIWYPHKLATQMNALKEAEFVLCYGGIVEIDEDGRKIRDVYPKHKTGYQLESQLHQFEIHLAAALVLASALKKYHLTFDDHLTASEEYNLFLRLSAKGPTRVVHQTLACYRISTTSLTTRTMSKWAHERAYTLDQLKNENPGVDRQFKDAFAEASARGDYYNARFLHSTGDSKAARRVMRSISGRNFRYRLLYVSLFVPYMWAVLHSNLLKRVILPKLLRIVG